MQGGFGPGLEPVNDSRVDSGQEALTADTEVGSYRTGCEHHVQVVAHLHDTCSSYDAWADAEHALPAGFHSQSHNHHHSHSNLQSYGKQQLRFCTCVFICLACSCLSWLSNSGADELRH